MASVISFVSAPSILHTIAESLLPVVADQLVQRVFSKTAYKEKASFAAAGVTYLLLSLHLSNFFKIGAPIFYLAYKTAQYYSSRQTPPDQEEPKSADNPAPINSSPTTTLPTTPTEPSTTTSLPPMTPDPSITTATTTTTPTEERAVPEKPKTIGGVPTAQVKAEGQAALQFVKFVDQLEKSEAIAITIREEPLTTDNSPKKKKPLFNAQIRFCTIHLFRLRENHVKHLNRENCEVTNETLFFWVQITNKKGKSNPTPNFLPLAMLDNLRPNAKEFSMHMIETDCQMTLQFKEAQMARLKDFAKTIKSCTQVKIIHNTTFITPFADTNNDEPIALNANEMASINGAKCYLAPFMKKT